MFVPYFGNGYICLSTGYHILDTFLSLCFINFFFSIVSVGESFLFISLDFFSWVFLEGPIFLFSGQLHRFVLFFFYDLFMGLEWPILWSWSKFFFEAKFGILLRNANDFLQVVDLGDNFFEKLLIFRFGQTSSSKFHCISRHCCENGGSTGWNNG